ncbi:MAG: aminotransferase class I/II-fold pyridoxal phosphate-dependent enzyme [Myxococcota bacterium]
MSETRAMLPLARPSIGDDERAAVDAVLQSGMLVMGAEVAAFEEEVAARVGRSHAVAVGSGTAALALAMEALGVGPGAEVLVPALTWPSPAHAARQLGAEVVLVDVDPDDWNGAAAAYAAARTERTALAVVIDQFGNPVDREALGAALGALPLLEDAACGLGSVDPAGRAAGSFGVCSTLSFHPRKVLTTGEGGMVLTDDAALAEELRWRRNHGQRGPGDFVGAAGNHRLTDLAAALGRSQLRRLDAIVDARRARAAELRAGLEGLPLQWQAEHGASNAQTFGVLPAERGAGPRLVAALRDRGIQAGRLSYDLTGLPSLEGARGEAPVAGHLARDGVALPLYAELRPEDAARVARAVRETKAEHRW